MAHLAEKINIYATATHQELVDRIDTLIEDGVYFDHVRQELRLTWALKRELSALYYRTPDGVETIYDITCDLGAWVKLMDSLGNNSTDVAGYELSEIVWESCDEIIRQMFVERMN